MDKQEKGNPGPGREGPELNSAILFSSTIKGLLQLTKQPHRSPKDSSKNPPSRKHSRAAASAS
ncbi:MAG: hypothetical protein ACT4O3_05445 [Elusimicrobiota bacterium]